MTALSLLNFIVKVALYSPPDCLGCNPLNLG